MVANYGILEVKVRTKKLITAWEMKCSPERDTVNLSVRLLPPLLSHRRVRVQK